MDVTTLQSIQVDYLNALALDAIKPRADYSLDGQTVSRQAWRDGMWRAVKEIQSLLQFAEPFELRGQTL